MAFARVIAQAKPAHAEAAKKSPRATAQGTAIVLANFELVGPFGLDAKTRLGQRTLLP
jgi:hypothetical protein